MLLSGARHTAAHTGYNDTFRFVGPASGEVADATWVAIDALQLPDEKASVQFLGRGMEREVLKALVGFRGACRLQSTAGVIATGNWGCGAFNGCPGVKALVQWAAASEAGVTRLQYHTWDDAATQEALTQLAALHARMSVGQLWTAAKRVAEAPQQHGLPAASMRDDGRHFLDAVARLCTG